MTNYLTADQILKADDTIFEDVDVPEWGGVVRVKGMSGFERDKFEASIRTDNGKRNMDNFRAKLAALTIVDGKGKRIFTNKEIQALGNKSASALDSVFTKAMELAGLSESDVDELTENFTEGQSEDSISN